MEQGRILKPAREKGQLTYEIRLIRITVDFSIETLKVKRARTNVIQSI